MKMSLISIDKGGFVRLSVDGEITCRDLHAGDGHNPLEKVLGESWANNRVLLSLAKTGFMDSSAIGWLLECQRKFKAAGGKLVLHSASPRVQDVFDLLKIGKALNLKENEKTAIELLTAA